MTGERESGQAGGAHSPFWRFSLKVYGLPGVAQACLDLQDKAGADVNVLLYVLWLGAQGRRLDRSETTQIIAAVASWRDEIVRPLRAVRRALKTPPPALESKTAEALRARIKEVELEGERLQQEMLYAWRSAEDAGRAEAPETAVAANAQVYAAALQACFSPAPVLKIVQAALSCAPMGGEES